MGSQQGQRLARVARPRQGVRGAPACLIRGADPATSKLAATLEQQCAFMFEHMRRVVEAGGATVEDIVKVTVWMKELKREPVNDEWVKMFPDPAARPARQIMEVPMEPGVLIQCDFMAVIERP